MQVVAAMPFSTDRTELIKARIQERLDTGLANDWEASFLKNMRERFDRFSSKTRLSDASYGKLYKLLELKDLSENPQSASSERRSTGAPTRQIPKDQPRAARSSDSQLNKPFTRLRSPVQIARSPERVIRRLKRNLFLPILAVLGLVVVLGSVFGPATST